MNATSKVGIALAVLAAGGLALSAVSAPARTGGSSTKTDSTSNDAASGQATAVFAMGCFWCAEADFEKVDGVVDVVSGYTGGSTKNPTYKQVTYANTGHYEAVLVTYDTSKLSYADLLPTFWKNVDPFDPNGQFCDKGSSYRSAIFPGNATESKAAKASKTRWESAFKSDIATAILDRSKFYKAEDYHQDYYKKNPIRYRFYRNGCGRDDRLEDIWGSVTK
ncbi:MAG: peptide-methionine (S)-S-oxide reductase MsrA [Erythrobacter sp.]